MNQTLCRILRKLRRQRNIKVHLIREGKTLYFLRKLRGQRITKFPTRIVYIGVQNANLIKINKIIHENTSIKKTSHTIYYHVFDTQTYNMYTLLFILKSVVLLTIDCLSIINKIVL